MILLSLFIIRRPTVVQVCNFIFNNFYDAKMSSKTIIISNSNNELSECDVFHVGKQKSKAGSKLFT